MGSRGPDRHPVGCRKDAARWARDLHRNRIGDELHGRHSAGHQSASQAAREGLHPAVYWLRIASAPGSTRFRLRTRLVRSAGSSDMEVVIAAVRGRLRAFVTRAMARENALTPGAGDRRDRRGCRARSVRGGGVWVHASGNVQQGRLGTSGRRRTSRISPPTGSSRAQALPIVHAQVLLSAERGLPKGIARGSSGHTAKGWGQGRTNHLQILAVVAPVTYRSAHTPSSRAVSSRRTAQTLCAVPGAISRYGAPWMVLSVSLGCGRIDYDLLEGGTAGTRSGEEAGGASGGRGPVSVAEGGSSAVDPNGGGGTGGAAAWSATAGQPVTGDGGRTLSGAAGAGMGGDGLGGSTDPGQTGGVGQAGSQDSRAGQGGGAGGADIGNTAGTSGTNGSAGGAQPCVAGEGGCADAWPEDDDKTEPGVCGCGVPETDTDGDLTPDCADGCSSDPGKIAPGVCGCGVPDSDTDGDGQEDCIDPCDGVNDASNIPDASCGVGYCHDTNALQLRQRSGGALYSRQPTGRYRSDLRRRRRRL